MDAINHCEEELSPQWKIKCNFVYIGRLELALNTRLKEHLDLKRLSHVTYNLYQMITQFLIKLELLEAFQIINHSAINPFTNQQINLSHSPLVKLLLTLFRS